MMPPAEQDIRSRLDRLLPKLLERYDVKGVSIAVRLPDGHMFDHLFGNDGAGLELNRSTQFRVASITKLLTALTILRLVELGHLDLDQPIGSVLGTFPATNNGACVRDVLAHVGGLPFSWKDMSSVLEAPANKPRATFQYSNAGYDLLGLVIERLTGQPYGEVAMSEVATPLQVECTLGKLPDGAPVATVDGKHKRHLNWTSLPSAEWPSGAMIATPSHAIRLLGGFAFPPAKFLSEPLVRTSVLDATGAVDHPQYPRDAAAPWGLGPELRGQKDRCFCGTHATRNSFGHFGGSGSIVWHDPGTRRSWAIFNTRTVGAAKSTERDDWVFEFWSDIGDKIVATN
jgi:CubicO group peptidase (beta-lactamase class C family)